MEESILINSIDRIDRLHSLIRHDFRDVGIKLPKSKKVKKQNSSRKSVSLCSQSSQEGAIVNKIFGEPLSQIPSTYLPHYGCVPQFLVSSAEFILKHAEVEGIFRKSGSIGRQKELRVSVEEGKSLDEANIHDVTSLVKQFFRELPDPLITPSYHDAFVKCFNLPPDKEPKESLLRMCLMLPVEHIGVLRYTMHLLYQVAQKSEHNRMSYNNLALVVAPNLWGSASGSGGPGSKMSSSEEKMLQATTCIVELFIKNWECVGMVPSSLRQQLSAMSECFATDDDLDASDDNMLDDYKDVSRKKKRRRSGSLTGLVSSIAQGFAKLRRSTDGKSINMSANSTFGGELSMMADASMASQISQEPDVSISDATPHIMRKRRASGDNVPFSSTKKHAILGNLPQRSALGSTPFTPSTLKKEQHSQKGPSDPRLNSTTPIMGTKASRKKLNLFTSPSNNKKMKRQTSPPEKSTKGKNIFKKIGSNREKRGQDDSAIASESISEELTTSIKHTPPKSAVSDTALNDPNRSEVVVMRSSSSSSLQDSECSIVVVDDESDPVFLPEEAIVKEAEKRRLPVRSKSVDSPGTTTAANGLPVLRRTKLDKSEISSPTPVVVPVIGHRSVDTTERNKDLRRSSRRDDFERQQQRKQVRSRADDQRKKAKETASNSKSESDKSKTTNTYINYQSLSIDDPPPAPAMDLDQSMASQLDSSLMEAVLRPPHGFGDETILMEEAGMVPDDEESPGQQDTSLIDVENDDVKSEAGFSTISGGTVMMRTKSGRYACKDGKHTVSGSSISSSGSGQKQPDNIYETLRPDAQQPTVQEVGTEGEYVVLRHNSKPISKPAVDRQSVVENSKGMRLLCENYHSSEEDSSSTNTSTNSAEAQALNITISSHQDELESMPGQTDVSKEKSLSAEDLMCARAARLAPPSRRAQSLYLGSPSRKFNYKPHLEISRETHTILSRAGYLSSWPAGDKVSCDVPVPVKSPPRSVHREEMIAVLRSSFNERHSRLDASLRSTKSKDTSDLETTEVKMAGDTSISSDYEKLSISSQDSLRAAGGDTGADIRGKKNEIVESGIKQKVMELSENVKTVPVGDFNNMNSNCSAAVGIDDKPLTKADIIKPTDISAGTSNDPDMKVAAAAEASSNANVKLLKEQDKSLTLSGILDKGLASQVKIKRAEMLIPKHDSILDVKQAGIVAQSVRHFSQPPPKIALPKAQGKGSSASVRIPTVFAKSEEKLKNYKEIAGFVRERTGEAGFINMPQTPATPTLIGKQTVNHEDDDIDDEGSDNSESDEGNVTVVEVPSNPSENISAGPSSSGLSKTDQSRHRSPISQKNPSESENTIEVCTPQKRDQQQLKGRGLKSPLLESTNTAASFTPGSRPAVDFAEALSLCNPTKEAFEALAKYHKTSRPPTPGSRLPQVRPQIKRLKSSQSPHRMGSSTREGEEVATPPIPKFSAAPNGTDEAL